MMPHKTFGIAQSFHRLFPDRLIAENAYIDLTGLQIRCDLDIGYACHGRDPRILDTSADKIGKRPLDLRIDPRVLNTHTLTVCPRCSYNWLSDQVTIQSSCVLYVKA